MKRFLIISALVLSSLSALACGGWERPNYYVFSVYNRNQLQWPFIDRITQFWNDYTGSDFDMWVVTGLSWTTPDDFNDSSNDLVKWAIEHKDSEMRNYLYNLVTYLQISNSLDLNEWDYPSKQSLAAASGKLKSLQRVIKQYSGKRFAPQYSLLMMRTLLAQRDLEGIVSHWNDGKGRTAGVFTDMERDIYAYALLNRDYSRPAHKVQARTEAKRIYAEVGDMQSLMWLVRDQRNLAGIQTEYMGDPNSATLLYLVQDYVNNAQDYYDMIHSEWYDPQYDDTDRSAVERGMRDFIVFARQVVAQGKTTQPAMWQTAAGYVAHLMGNSTQGLQLIDQALKMKGSARVMDNARACRFIASLASPQNSDKWLDGVTTELQWLEQKAHEDDGNKNAPRLGDNHYAEVLQVAIYDRLSPQLKKWGRTNQAVALERKLHAGLYGADSNDDSYDTNIEELTAQQTIDLMKYAQSKPKTAFDRYIHAGTQGMSDMWMNDRIGTKFLREGQFKQAIPYLEKVSLDFLSQQAISRYAARRDYTLPRWMGRQVVDRNWEDMWDAGPATVKQNQKLLFCRNVLNLQGRTDAQSLYDLATIYYQASYQGDCWYLARYAWSSADTVTYTGEFDFVKATIDLLRQVRDRTQSFDLKEQSIYALAFIRFGEPYITYTWDADYNQIPHYNRASYEYQTMRDLRDFYRENRTRVHPYVSHCDVLRQFQF